MLLLAVVDDPSGKQNEPGQQSLSERQPLSASAHAHQLISISPRCTNTAALGFSKSAMHFLWVTQPPSDLQQNFTCRMHRLKACRLHVRIVQYSSMCDFEGSGECLLQVQISHLYNAVLETLHHEAACTHLCHGMHCNWHSADQQLSYSR